DGRGCVGRVEGHLVRRPGAVFRRGHGDLVYGDRADVAGGQVRVLERRGDRVITTQRRRLGGRGGPRQRGGDAGGISVVEQHGEQPVVPGGQAAEALPEQYGGAVADLAHQQRVHRRDGGGVQRVQVLVVGEVLPRRRDGVGRKTARPGWRRRGRPD